MFYIFNILHSTLISFELHKYHHRSRMYLSHCQKFELCFGLIHLFCVSHLCPIVFDFFYRSHILHEDKMHPVFLCWSSSSWRCTEVSTRVKKFWLGDKTCFSSWRVESQCVKMRIRHKLTASSELARLCPGRSPHLSGEQRSVTTQRSVTKRVGHHTPTMTHWSPPVVGNWVHPALVASA